MFYSSIAEKPEIITVSNLSRKFRGPHSGDKMSQTPDTNGS